MAEGDLELRRFDGRGITLAEQPRRTVIDVRGNPSDARFLRALESVTDLPPPLAPGTSASGLLATLLWMGPDEWLVASEVQAGEGLAASLAAALRGIPSAVTDVSDARIVYAVRGSNARDLLARGSPLDLHDRAFRPGRCARSVLAKVPAIVHRASAEPAFEVHVARSYRDYAWEWFLAAAADYA